MKSQAYSLRIVVLLALLSASGFLLYKFLPHSAAAGSQPVVRAARWGAQTQIFAAQRGNPWINVKDGHEIVTDFAGAPELQAAFADNQSRPLSLATADFDEDGTPDLVAGYVHDKGGAASFMRGNVDAVYPNAPEAKERKANGAFTDTPFLGPAQLFALPVTPDFLGTGDFDADGHWDIVAAARNATSLYFLKGDGRGGFVLAKRVELAGAVTALLTDDFNRRDGLNDVLVGVQTKQNAQLLVFEHPYGAITAQPEVFTFAAPVTSLAIGLPEGDARFDVAIAAGRELAILRGRDRKLLFDESGKSADAPQITRRKFDFEIDALAVGEFLKGEIFKTEIALLSHDGKIHLLENGGTTDANGNLSAAWHEKETVALPHNSEHDNAPVMLTARVSARSVDTLVVGLGEQVHLLTSDITPPKSENEAINYEAQEFNLAASLDVASRMIAVLPMRLNLDALSDLVVMRENSVVPTIVQTAPMATFTVESNSNIQDPDLTDGICNTPPLMGGVYIGPCTYLSSRQQANVINGASRIDFAVPVFGTPTFLTPQFGILRPLTIDGTTQGGGFVEFTGVSNQFPATHFTGSQTDNCVFRGMVANGFVGANSYINLQSDNHIVEGNRLGTNVAGTVVPAATNGNAGLNSSGVGNLLGGTTAAARNIVSSADTRGVTVSSNSPAGNPTRVQGNYIGTDISGTVALGNSLDGLRLQGMNNLIGGTTAGAGNVISATTGSNASGIFGGGPGILIQGNRIGTNAAGTAALGNLHFGISSNSALPFDTLGGTTPAARNIISGNGLDGVNISASNGSSGILGNYIGTNAAGNAAIPNGDLGLRLSGAIGLVSNNVISGNTGGGMQSQQGGSGSNAVISGNLIGTDATGTNPLGNNGVGLSVSNDGQQNGSITGNTIAANTSHGISNAPSLILDLFFQNNFIGTNSSLAANLGNGGDGIRFINQSRFNQIGGAGAGNTIAFNTGNGINFATTVISSTENRISHNSIFSNGGLGIDLSGNGVTANDNCDGENGPNTLQNYPVLTAANSANGSTTISGTLNSTASTTFTIDFYANSSCDASGNGEGQTFLGSTTVTTNAACSAVINATLPVALTPGTAIVTATAADSAGNTSEFSACRTVTIQPMLQFATAQFNVNEGTAQADITVTRTGNAATAVTVDYATNDNPNFVQCSVNNGQANQRCDYTTTAGRLDFAANETSKTFTIPISNDFYPEFTENLTITLSNPTGGAALGATTTATLAITDDDNVVQANRLLLARLDGPQEVPAVTTNATGTGTVLFNGDETQITVNMSFSGLSSTQIAAHIHGPAHVGANAPILFNLGNGTITNATFAVTPTQVAQLKAGLFYFNVHTANFPNGEIRGQILPNPLELPRFFVRQQYADFLSRVPDQAGWDYWTGQLTDVGSDLNALSARRYGVSNAFFFELEFQQTGAYVYRLYRAAFGNTQPFPNPETPILPNYTVFVSDRARVVGGANLAAAQLAVANAFVGRAEFTSRYPAAQTAAQFADALLGNIQAASGANLTSQRDALIALHNSNGRGAVLYRLADDNATVNPINNRAFIDAEYNRAFVATQYFGYLRRDADVGGFNFWLGVVNRFPLRSATGQNAMVCAFLTSQEYQERFSAVAPRGNGECPAP